MNSNLKMSANKNELIYMPVPRRRDNKKDQLSKSEAIAVRAVEFSNVLY